MVGTLCYIEGTHNLEVCPEIIMEDTTRRSVFSPREYRLFRVTAVFASVVALVALVVFTFWIASRVLANFSALLLPLAVAGVLALVLEPVVRLIQRYLKLRRTLAVSLLAVLVLLTLFMLYLLVLPIVAEQMDSLTDIAPRLIGSAHESLTTRFPGLITALEDELGSAEFGDVIPGVGSVFEFTAHYAGLLVGFSFMPLFLLFMLLAGQKLPDSSRELIFMFREERQEEIAYLGRMFIGYITAFFQGQLLVGFIMGVMLAIGFTLIGLQGAIMLGLVLGLLNIVPFLGTVVGLAIALPVAWIQPTGGVYLVGLTALVFVVVQLVESWVLTPRIMSERSGLHPAIVIASLFFWGNVFSGIIGLILAVPLSAFFVALWQHVKKNYFDPDGQVKSPS